MTGGVLDGDELQGVPAMPVIVTAPGNARSFRHRPRDEWPFFNACVARILDKKEIARRKDAQEALKLEGAILAAKDVWLLNGVREKSDVVNICKVSGKKGHFAHMFGICAEKGSELKQGDPKRYCKGRYVCAGDRARDEPGAIAHFLESS